MKYQINQTKISADKEIAYSLFKRTAIEDTLSADTYGVIAANFDCSLTVDDVTTDASVAEELLTELSENCIEISSLHEYILDYLSRL